MVTGEPSLTINDRSMSASVLDANAVIELIPGTVSMLMSGYFSIIRFFRRVNVEKKLGSPINPNATSLCAASDATTSAL